MKHPLILAIDTSCDETAAAVTQGRQVLSNVIASQINIHRKYGGVVPHLAKRAHEAKIEFVVRETLKRIPTLMDHIDAVAVTIGPGLAPALEVGIAYAKNLAREWKKPLIAINHMEGHLLSSLALPNSTSKVKKSPTLEVENSLALLVSGGHTQLILIRRIGSYQLLGETLDDAGGEALDKLAKMLHLGYPGGPIIEIMAKKGNPDLIDLPVPVQYSHGLDFSYSGLKTAAVYQIKSVGSVLTKKYIYDMCAGFQKAIALSLTTKLKKAIDQYRPRVLLLGGGVTANLYIRRQIRSAVKTCRPASRPLPIFLPYSKKLYTDNAAMIGVAAYWHYLKKDFVKDIAGLDRQPNLNFERS